MGFREECSRGGGAAICRGPPGFLCSGASFLPTQDSEAPVYKDVVRKYARVLGLDPSAVCVHGLRATAATNALDHEADIAKVQEWLGHASIATTRLYDRRKTKPEDSPTFKVSYY